MFALAWDFSVLFTLEREPLPRLPVRLERPPPPLLPARRRAPVQRLAPPEDRRRRRRARLRGRAGPDDPALGHARAPRATSPAASIPIGRPYPPVHDVQMMVDGDAAAALGELARARWQRRHRRSRSRRRPAAARRRSVARGDRARRRATRPIGIARTHAAPSASAPAVQEVAALRAATRSPPRAASSTSRTSTSPRAAIGAALARRLAEPDGPEVVAVLPARGARLAGAELDGRHARAPAAAPARQRPPRPPAAALPDDPGPASARA